MKQFLRITQNELEKIYRRPSTWVMTGLVVLIVVASSLFSQYFFDEEIPWREQLTLETTQLQQEADVTSGTERAQIEDEIAINLARLKQDLPPLEETYVGVLIDTVNLAGILSLFTIVVTAGLVAREFSSGTIKLLLIRPVRRSKIWISKYVASFGFTMFLLAVLMTSALLMGLLLNGFSQDAVHVDLQNGAVGKGSLWLYVFKLYGLKSAELIIIMTITFVLATISRSATVAISVSFILVFTSPQIVMLLSKYTWMKYVLFSNIDLLQYVENRPLIEGMTFSFSLSILLLYWVLLMVTALYIFEKRDVAD
ncbi:ABC transporter permease [Exiguobacterium sp.]|uniref:ABC transporter permease n=1 Tax=Exiguobacterium sp. TaxID=44751 RepID=UPI00391D52AE